VETTLDKLDASGEEIVNQSETLPAAANRDIHRIGGASVENLRLKPREAALDVPGISVLKSPTPGEAARQMRGAFPKAKVLHEAAKTVGSTAGEMIRRADFELIPAPSDALPNHWRIVHPEGVSGFKDENLVRLVEVFVNTTGH
jgi:hypothetical protein